MSDDPYRTPPVRILNAVECDHGVTFDEEEAKRLCQAGLSSEIRKRWPRLFGECPKNCGYNGIAYASMAHYVYGDW